MFCNVLSFGRWEGRRQKFETYLVFSFRYTVFRPEVVGVVGVSGEYACLGM